MTAPANLIEVEGLTKHFPRRAGFGGGGVVRAVEDVTFSIREGETLGLVGESGCGKSTTGRLLLRLLEPTRGSCRYRGREVFQVSRRELRALRRELQIVFQDPYGAFNPRLTVGAIVGEALELRGVPPAKRPAEVERMLEMVQLPGDVRNRYPHEFSGGQRQRIGIARALAVEPRFLVADEPVSALDVSTQAEIVNLLLELQGRLGLTVLFISHDLSVVRLLSDRVAVLFAGRLMEVASARELFERPLHPYTRELLTAIPLPDPRRAQREPRARPSEGARADLARAAETGCPYASRCPLVMPICLEQMPALVDFAPRIGEDQPHQAACHHVEQQYPPPPAVLTGGS